LFQSVQSVLDTSDFPEAPGVELADGEETAGADEGGLMYMTAFSAITSQYLEITR
jgi:hypothetical protein